MKNTSADLIFGQASREHLSLLFDRLFRLFLNSLIEHKIGDDIDDFEFILSELDRSPDGDLGMSLNRFTIARFLAPGDRPLQLRPRQHLRQLRAVDPQSAAAWGEMCSLCSLILEYRNSHQHNPNNNPTRTRDLLLVGAIVRVHELGDQLLSPDDNALLGDPSFYSEMLAQLSAEGQIRAIDASDDGGASDELNIPKEGTGEPEDSTSDILSILSRLHVPGCVRLLDGVFGRPETEDFRYTKDSSSEFKAKMKSTVAEALSTLETEPRTSLIRFFFDVSESDDTIDEESVLKALRILRHPNRSEKLRPLLFFPDDD